MRPAEHAFEYRLFMLYLDLAELEQVFAGRWLWSTRRAALARFMRKDHLGDPGRPLDEAVRDLVAERTGRRPAGPVRLLTQLRYFGYVFNPLSLYYCFDADGAKLEAVVAEVNNTPWGERHCYVLDARSAGQQAGRYRFESGKRLHVSPFMPMDIDYGWRLDTPGTALHVHIENFRQGAKLFDATLNLERIEIGSVSLARVLARYPFMTLRVIGAIHWQALKLWWKGVPLHDHPDKAMTARGSET